MKKDFVFSSASVTEGHPDKLCDQISDAIVDHFLEQAPLSRVIAECAVSSSIVFIAARFASDAVVDFPNIARKVIQRVGYDQADFNPKTCSILTSLQEMPADDWCCFDEHKLSDEEIEGIHARDQATVFGFACNQTPELMPLPVCLAHELARQYTLARRQKRLPYLAPEAKIDVGIEYRNRSPYRLHSITITASQNKSSEPDLARLREEIARMVITPVFEGRGLRPDDQTEIYVNPEGRYLFGGPSVHSGLTGRKNGIDTYGEYARQSSAALSGKDPLRIDRVGVYAARYAAKNLVAAGLADECEVQLSYSIGRSRPVSIQIETFGTGKVPDDDLAALLDQHFDFRLAAIVRAFDLRNLPAKHKGAFYQRLAVYGHVGRMDLELPWETTDKVEILQSAALKITSPQRPPRKPS
jgi:S-adenosylmethionine synthetase